MLKLGRVEPHDWFGQALIVTCCLRINDIYPWIEWQVALLGMIMFDYT
jgi:hypothetical protein